GENFASALAMQTECLHSGNIPILSYAQNFVPRSIEIEGNGTRIDTDYDVGRRFENSSEPGLCRLRSLTFADLALERDHLFLQFVLCCLQRAILRLNLRQHLVERVGQSPHLVVADLRSPHGIVVVVGDRPRYAGKAQNRIGDKPQELTRKQEREKKRSGKNQRENAAVEFEKLRRHCVQIRD